MASRTLEALEGEASKLAKSGRRSAGREMAEEDSTLMVDWTEMAGGINAGDVYGCPGVSGLISDFAPRLAPSTVWLRLDGSTGSTSRDFNAAQNRPQLGHSLSSLINHV